MPPMPKSLGKYSLLRELGRGGMGVVYEALDTELQRKVALKLLLSDPLSGEASGSVEEERFVREARLSAKLKHPNIVTVYEAGMLEGRRYLALQLIDGVSLSGWLAREAGAGLRRKVALLRDVALAVAHAHEQGVFHRDLKPQNVLLDAEGRPYVSDFGLARRAGREAAASLTVSGSVVGTPAYMSPEQARGLKTLDARSDVYSLGIMLYEMLAGRTPFQGDTPLDILMKVVNNPAPPPSSVSKSWEESTAGDAIETICLKAIAKDPRRRFPTARAFADDLGRWLKGQQILATPPAPPASLAWLWISIAAAAVVALGIVTLMPSDRAEREPPAKSARPPQGVDAEKERLTRERQAAADEAERVRRESAKEREEARLREAERAKRELELKTESAAEKEALTAKLRDAEARARAAEEEARKAKLDPPPKSVEPRVRPPEPAPKPEPPKPPAPPVFRKPAEPPAADLKAAEKALQGRFKEDYARKATSETRAFAARLLELGLKEDPDTTARFAILQEARELASLNGVPETAAAAVEALIRVFQVDARPLRSQTLQALAKSAVVATSMREAAAAGFRLSAGAVADDDYDAALQLLAQSDLLARRAADADLQSVAAARVREVTEVRREWGHVRAAFKTLQEKPDDAASNTAAGRFL
ncbi:MAG: protein kinase, partial [Planctomycetes bacterium]|nr:protein kinase [Planctomycetota bacterium]